MLVNNRIQLRYRQLVIYDEQRSGCEKYKVGLNEQKKVCSMRDNAWYQIVWYGILENFIGLIVFFKWYLF